MNGKSFSVDPEKTTNGGFDVAVSSTDATVTGLLSGKRAHIPRTDMEAFDTEAFDRQIQSEVPGIVADAPVPISSMAYGVAGGIPSYTNYRHAVVDSLFTSRPASHHPFTIMAAGVGAGTATQQSWWQWTKEKWKNAWTPTKEFVKKYWLDIVCILIVLILIAVIVAIIVISFGPAIVMTVFVLMVVLEETWPF